VHRPEGTLLTSQFCDLGGQRGLVVQREQREVPEDQAHILLVPVLQLCQ
jgi:hypothetical protein